MKKHNNDNNASLNLEQSPNQDAQNNGDVPSKTEPKKRKVWKVLCVFMWIILMIPILIVTFSGVVVVMEAMSSPNNIPGNFEYKPCVERYGFMEPDIQKGDFIIVQKTDVSELEVGDVVAYHFDDNDSIGRIIYISQSGLTVKADSDAACNEIFVPNDNIQGKWYGFRIPFLGWIVLFVQESWWLLIVIPAIIEALIIVGNLFRKSFSKKNQQMIKRLLMERRRCR